MRDKLYNVAIIGATGVVGEVLLGLLKDRDFPVGDIYVLASEESAGKKLLFGNKSVMVLDVASFNFESVDFAFLPQVQGYLGNMFPLQLKPAAW